MELEGMMLSEISWTEKDTAQYHLYVESNNKKVKLGNRVEKWLPGAVGWRK